MSWFFRKTHNLIFDRRTVSRTYTLNHTAVHCRTTEIVVYNLVSFFICIHKIARNKIFADILRFKRKRHDFSSPSSSSILLESSVSACTLAGVPVLNRFNSIPNLRRFSESSFAGTFRQDRFHANNFR